MTSPTTVSLMGTPYAEVAILAPAEVKAIEASQRPLDTVISQLAQVEAELRAKRLRESQSDAPVLSSTSLIVREPDFAVSEAERRFRQTHGGLSPNFAPIQRK
jgi:hypothetical protein